MNDNNNNDIYDKCVTLSMANVKRKLISWAVSSTGRCIKPSVCKCFGVDTDSAIVSPNASWKAEINFFLVVKFGIKFYSCKSLEEKCWFSGERNEPII